MTRRSLTATRARLAAASITLAPAVGAADPGGLPNSRPPPPRSAPLTNIRYEITFDSTTAASRTIQVGMTFDVAGPGPGAALVPGLDAGRVRAQLIRALGLQLLGAAPAADAT